MTSGFAHGRVRSTFWTCLFTGLLLGASLLLLPRPALASCHEADINPKQVTATEAKTKIEFTVTILGSGTFRCEGKVAYETINGSAKGGSDFVTTSGAVRFSPAENQRSKKFTVELMDDTTHESRESFVVRIKTHPENGGIHPVPDPNPATVTINDNDVAPSPSPTPTTRTQSPSPSPTATVTATATPSPTASATPTETATPTGSPTPTPSPTESEPVALPPDESSGKGGMVAAIAVGVILAGGGVGLWLLRRRYGFR